MSPNEIKESLTEEQALKIFDKLGESEFSRDQLIASVMFVLKMGEEKATEYVDWNLAELGQMEVDLEIRSKFDSENSNALYL